jgi:hypothetical protein
MYSPSVHQPAKNDGLDLAKKMVFHVKSVAVAEDGETAEGESTTGSSLAWSSATDRQRR